MIELRHVDISVCNYRVSPSSERLHNQMWLHRFDIISLSIMSGRNNTGMRMGEEKIS